MASSPRLLSCCGVGGSAGWLNSTASARRSGPRGTHTPYVRLPWWQTHATLFAWEYAVRGKGADVGLGRPAGARLAMDYLEVSVRHRLWRRARRARFRLVDVRNALLGPPVRAALRVGWLRRLARALVVRTLAAVEEAVERHASEP